MTRPGSWPGVLLLSLVTVETGGLYLLKLWRSSEGVTEFQIGFARAGHAHAGVLLVLSLDGAAVRRHGRPLGWPGTGWRAPAYRWPPS